MDTDGQNLVVIVRESLIWPNALTLDPIAGYVFWGDAGHDYIGG